MKKFSWSKWIAIALSVFIVIQFIQVSFLAAGQIGGARADAGSDASRGSIAGDIYQGVWDKVGDGDMILTAGAAGESTIGVRLLEASADTLDLSGAGENAFDLNFALSFTPAANAEYLSLGSGKTISIALPEGIQGNFSETAPVSVTRMEVQEAADPEAEPVLESVNESREDIVSAELNDNVLSVTVAPIAYEQLFTAIDDALVTVSAQLSEAAAGRAAATWTYPAGNDAEVTGATVTVVYPAGGSSSTAMAGPEDPVPDPAADPAAGSSKEENAGTGASSDAGIGATSDAGEGGSADAGTGGSDAGTGASDAGTGASDAATAGSSGSTEANTANTGSTAGSELRLAPTTGGTPERTGNYDDGKIKLELKKAEVTDKDWVTDYISWSVEISRVDEPSFKLEDTTITVTPGQGQTIGRPDKEYWKLYDENNSIISDTSWELQGKSTTQIKSTQVVFYTYPTRAQWNTEPIFSCTISVSIDGDDTPDVDFYMVTDKGWVPSLKIKAVDKDTDSAIKDKGVELSLKAEQQEYFAPSLSPKDSIVTWKTTETDALGTKEFTKALAYGHPFELGVIATGLYAAGSGSRGSITITDDDGDGTLEVNLDTDMDLKYVPEDNTLYVYLSTSTVGTLTIGRVVGTSDDPAENDVQLKGAVFWLYSDVPGGSVSHSEIKSGEGGFISVTAALNKNSTYYLVQKTSVDGFMPDQDNNGDPIIYTFLTDDDGKVDSQGSEWETVEWHKKERKGDFIVNPRRPGTLEVVRADLGADKNAPNSITYQIYEDEKCEGTSVGAVIISKLDKTYTGTSDADLEWDKDYFIFESDPGVTGYSHDEKIHGPYKFNSAMKSGKDTLSSCDYTADVTNMKITAKIKPQIKVPVKFVLQGSDKKPIDGVGFKITDDAIKNDAGQMIITQSETTAPWNVTDPDIAMLLTGDSYTAEQQDNVTSGKVAVRFKFTVGNDGKVTIKTGSDIAKATDAVAATATKTGTPATITMSEATPKMTISMEICTAEDGEYKIEKEQEVAPAPSGFAFSIYVTEDCESGSIPINVETGKPISGLKTDSKGVVTISGLEDGDYYLKSTQASAVNNAQQVLLDKDSSGDYSVFKVTQEGGVLTSLTKVGSSGRWEVKNNKIRAKLKKGSVTIKAQSDKTFYLYRLYAGDGSSDDKRESKKMSGATATFSSTDKKNYFVTATTSSSSGSSKSASLDKMLLQGLKELDSLFVLKAKAAESASKISYAGQTWQLIASNQPGNGGSHTFEGLIAGQNYLIREGSEDDSEKKYYLASVTADRDQSITSSTASSGSSNASTAKSTSGSGTGSGGGSAAGGGRGAATGDSNKLWFHLIIMLIAFDALAADLLYISRKKQRA